VADHPRLAILKALTTHLEGIHPDEGFTHNMAGRVFRGRTLFGDNDPVPFLSILESPRPDIGLYAGGNEARSEDWELLIQGFADTDTVNPTDPLYPLLGDVEARLMQIIFVDGNSGDPKYPTAYMLRDADGRRQITDLKIGSPVVRPPGSEPTAKACFLLPLRVGLALDVG
jgi:hypothetical protein